MFGNGLHASLMWLFRAYTSRLISKAAESIWVYDSFKGPDGYPLMKKYIDRIPIDGVKGKFGPSASFLSPFYFLLSIKTFCMVFLFSRQIDDEIHKIIYRKLIGVDRNVTIVCGSMNSTYVKLLSKMGFINFLEVQHGFLDHTYFTTRPSHFYARSNYCKNIAVSKGVASTLLDNDLEYPELSRIDISDISEFVRCTLYSKNPGGGCTVAELIEFERLVFQWARRNGLKLRIKLHPRDNIIKFFLRHKKVYYLKYLFAGVGISEIVISSMSSALFTEVKKGQILINVRFPSQRESDYEHYTNYFYTCELKNFLTNNVVQGSKVL